ncbi:AMP_1a_G0000020.mRNA.1.CDS.1 [Saccharomyces cerevisiae]|nr:AMP_1a_G0000020.mRNA.1.CDS.1 [Saccharomyces cerevisiae]CAI6465566.1 AMP_1a_G0000020.mRNA.1.CDS.1 [Saccharomyces cerevisiae]
MEQLRESKTEVLQVLLNWDEKSARKNGRQKTIRSLWKRSRKLSFQRLRSMTSAGLQGSAVRQAAVQQASSTVEEQI